VKSFRPRRIAWLTLDAAERERAKSALVNERRTATAGNNVARRVIAAAQGRLVELPRKNRPAL
jgi:hypothetical protein